MAAVVCHKHHVSNEKNPGCLGYRRLCHGYVGIIVYHYKDPRIPIKQPEFNRSKAGFFSWLMCCHDFSVGGDGAMLDLQRFI